MNFSNSILESQILWNNAKYLGIDLTSFYIKAGQSFAEQLIKLYGPDKKYGFILGMGGNAADGLATAYFLKELGVKNVEVYVLGRRLNSQNPVLKKIWDEILAEGFDLNIVQDCFYKDIKKADVYIECVSGTGFEGKKLTKRAKDVIKKISASSHHIVGLDIPVPHYKPKRVFSIAYAKTKNAVVIPVSLPARLVNFCGPGELAVLWSPRTKSHKKQNGKLMLLKGSDFIPSKELVLSNYALTDSYNMDQSLGFCSSTIGNKRIDYSLNWADCIGVVKVDNSFISQALLKEVFNKFSHKRFVISADVLDCFGNDLLGFISGNIVVFKSANSGKAKRFAIENGVVAVCIGIVTNLFSPNGETRIVSEKVDYDDYFFRVATYFTKNDAWLSARAAVIPLK